MKKLTCFKAYDIRGKLGEELNEDIAWRIGRAYGEFLKPKTIVLGGDVRLTSETLKLALAKGLQDAGVDVLDIGMSGTEEIRLSVRGNFNSLQRRFRGNVDIEPFGRFFQLRDDFVFLNVFTLKSVQFHCCKFLN